MKTRHLLLALLSLVSLQATAANGGIESSNYSLAVGASKNDWFRGYDLSGTVRLPLVDYVGLTLGAGVHKAEESDKWRNDMQAWGYSASKDDSTTIANIGMVFRDFSIGKVTADYTRSDVDSSTTINNTTFHDDYYMNSYQLSGTYFAGRFDLEAARTWFKIDFDSSDSKGSGTFFDVGYYPTDNLRVEVGTDADTEVYTLSIMYQPQLFNNNIGLDFSMMDLIDSDNVGPSYNLNLIYYFGTKVNLIDRIRRY